MRALAEPAAIVLMGVSGSGKTSVGMQLSALLGWPFFDGDDFHPASNIEKMAKGIPLDDADRQPWLEALHRLIAEHLTDGKSVLVACSALKKSYRDVLRGGYPGVVFIYLRGSFDLIYSRMRSRAGHYMQAEMLQSQFDDLEPPVDALVVDVRESVGEISQEIIQSLLV